MENYCLWEFHVYNIQHNLCEPDLEYDLDFISVLYLNMTDVVKAWQTDIKQGSR